MRSLFAVVAICAPFGAYAQDADAGRALYRTHCATCHGLEARGDGPMAGVLTIKPVDLTALSAQNGGDFPLERVVRRIDGREPLVAHGSPMPVYGDYFDGVFDVPVRAGDGDRVFTSRPVVDLVGYLQSIQRTDD